MAYNSFYGGAPGFPFVIVKSYPSIADMVADFQKGPDFSAVHFNEHVLINTWNKNDPDNGKMFRRGMDYTNDMGGAVYIGTIVGPAGRAPMLEMTTIEEVKKVQAAEGYDYRYSEGSYAPLDNLIPGKVSDTKFNDEIQWACCSVRNENDEDSTAYIGFIFPYTVIEFTANTVSPYYNRSNDTADFINERLSDRTDDKQHPYFENWNFSIPKGIKGDTFKDFRVIAAADIIEDYSGKEDDITNNREVLVYDYYHYDKEEGGEPATIYLGDYNMIDEITVDDEGTVTIDYSHDDDAVFTKLLKWIKKVTLDGKTGHLKVEYNHATDKDGNPTTYETDLSWIDYISLADDGTVTLKWTTGETEDLPTHIKWIKNVELKPDGTGIVNYNDGTKDTFEKQIKYIDRIYFNESEQKFHIVYNTGVDETVDSIIKFIDNVYIKDQEENEEDNDYRFHVVYNTGDDEAIGNPINYIEKTVIDEKDYHCLVYYSNYHIRKALTDEGKTREYDGKPGWLDLGSVRDDDGILIGMDILATAENGLDIPITAIPYLNNLYPEGLTAENMHGKIITIGLAGGHKKFYAFDYSFDENENYKGWYFLGTLGDAAWTLVAKADDPYLEQKKSQVSIGGVWFIVEESNA